MAKYNIGYTGEQIDECLGRFFNSLNTVVVVTQSGSTVTMTKDGTTLTAEEDDGKWVFHPLEFGTWTITTQKNLSTNSRTINIDCIKIYDTVTM